MYTIRASTAIKLVAALCCVARGASSWGQVPDDVYETLMRGLEHRQTLVTSVSGEAVEESFLSQAYWNTRLAVMAEMRHLVQAAGTEEERPSTERYDRGSFLVRFRLGEQDWDFEAQALIWPGGYTNWGIERDFTQPPAEGFPFYSRVSVRDGFQYSERRSNGRPRGDVSRVQLDRPGPLQPPFCTWLTLGLGRLLWPDRLRDDRYHVVSIEQEQLGEWACYHVTGIVDSTDFISEKRVWIAPDATFAVVRNEALTIEKANPKRGFRDVRAWSGLEEVEGVAFLPTLYQSDSYEYGRGTDTPWVHSTRVRLREITCVQDPVATPFAVGVVVNPVGNIGPDADADPLTAYPRAYAAWHDAMNVFLHEPLPPDNTGFAEANAEYLRQLDGTEMAEMKERAGL